MKRITLVIIFLMVLSYQFSVFPQDNRNRREPAVIEEQISPEMYVVNNKLHVKNATIGKRVEIITIIGNKVKEIQITSVEFEHNLNIPRGIYLIKMDGKVIKALIR